MPWANWEDWLEVYKWLDSSDAHDVQKGLDKVWLSHSMHSRQSGTLHLPVRWSTDHAPQYLDSWDATDLRLECAIT